MPCLQEMPIILVSCTINNSLKTDNWEVGWPSAFQVILTTFTGVIGVTLPVSARSPALSSH